MGVVSRRWMWVESMGVASVVVRRYILILTPLVYICYFFAAASLLFVHFLKCFSFLYIIIYIYI